jgi:hypothetical protein
LRSDARGKAFEAGPSLRFGMTTLLESRETLWESRETLWEFCEKPKVVR